MSQGQSKPFTYRQSYLLNIEFNFVCITSTYFYLVYKKCLDSRWNYFYIYMYMYYTQYNGRHYFGHRGKNYSIYWTCMRKNKQVYITEIS